MDAASHIHIKGAREHNLRNLELRIPRGKLVVLTGPSGSGKSSLAFDTIYAEGYRKYMESLSASARQVLEQLKRPDVDFIHGLSPVLAIEQRTGGGSPRSTVATVTEVADYARLLWALCGEQRCPKDGGRVTKRSLDDCVKQLFRDAPGERAIVLAPWMTAKPSVLRDELPRLRQRGFQRVRVAGEIKSLDEPRLVPNGAEALVVELVVDRLVVSADQRSRLADSLELAFREGQNRALVLVQKTAESPWREIPLSQSLSCVICGDVFAPLTPRNFSFNHSEGACTECGGLGRKLTFSEELIVARPDKSIREGAIKPWRIGGRNLIIRHNSILKQLAEQLPFDPEIPWQDLPAETRQALLHGAGERLFSFRIRRTSQAEAKPFPGIIAMLDQSRRESRSDGFRARLSTFMASGDCPSCHGLRLNARSAAVRVGVVSDQPEGDAKIKAGPVGERAYLGFAEFMGLDIRRALEFMQGLRAVLPATDAVREVLDGVTQRLHFLAETGLGYLTLEREYATLSGGEAQRVRLATQLGMGLVGVIYVLDEPSIGLHPHDNQRLLATLRELRDRGNTVLVVEHDADTMRIADELIELGPGAGTEGGQILFQGSPVDCAKLPATTSRTGAYLGGKLGVEKDAKLKKPDDRWLVVKGAAANNLKNVEARFPVGLLTCVTGVSGSGKSTLVNDILAVAAARKLNGATKEFPGKHRGLTGLDHFEKAVQVDQEPIGRSPRSNPASYVGLLDLLRDLFAKLPLAKVRGYKANRFSFNVRGGRCERCQGDGQIRLDMQFMADAYAPCPSCDGQRFNRETLEVRYHGKSIADVLDLTVREAMELFRAHPRINEKLVTLDAVGLGYLHLGQSATTLSGGEAQRIKLSLELSKREQGTTLYILDEPTTGLNWTDIQRLVDLLFKLRDAGNTLVVIEHNLDVIRLADWVVDLGPGGGPEGGQIVYAGAVEGLVREKGSLTGVALAEEGKK
ncbi:UvrABC system protein A [Lacunisphaera limnophila]|uniref:UvrABC system protein A n=1 Tax=Lacunisphaera limnophila TaxID=1838286 RepID=A0A1D8AYR9_9BACT|nr:excinuclease ABC subunit UvrA [Lacunisphaera limnophila]AOS46015.1 UvrABC system protein A [Lacunisphaera limnophila]